MNRHSNRLGPGATDWSGMTESPPHDGLVGITGGLAVAYITPETDVAYMVVKWPETADVLHAHDFVKIQLLAGEQGTVGGAAAFYHDDLDALLRDLNSVVEVVEKRRAENPPQKKRWKDR